MAASKLLVGIDIGLTNMKAVAFDEKGVSRFEARGPSSQITPKPHHVERVGADFWRDLCAMLRDLTDQINAIGRYEIAAVSLDAHGDGVWLINDKGEEIRPGILSLDSRAIETSQRLNAEHEEDLLRVTGQNTGPASPGAILRWLLENEPESIEKADYYILAHDYLRVQLTGTIGTDLTSASQAFTDVKTQEYSDEAFEIYGLECMKDKVAPINDSIDIAGGVTAKAAAETGLPEGTPVLAGMHDIDAGTIGTGAVSPGQMALMAGTWCINSVVSDHAKISPDWFARAFVKKGHWLNMSISPAGSSNLEWFVSNLAKTESDVLRNSGVSPFAFVDYEVSKIKLDDSYVIYTPYIYGNPMNIDAAGTFSGIRAWHTRGHMLRAIYEALAFNHLHHSAPMIEGFGVEDIRVSGGVAQSKLWPQILADTFNTRIGVPVGGESGALGGAMAAAVSVGIYDSLEEAASAMGPDIAYVEPNKDCVGIMEERYGVYREFVDHMIPWWNRR
ncbi:FGGY-family carbohydrate kinase [Propionimicrobium lymphophilum]|uniref:FGGY-family carbohydrate kinase n=1 Tax=Propionimicrobium lymphophilum TaxID=33012 RepID=UPI00288B4BC4|nr:FGGY-family carbohydrate kinase [Propionimicrobium lymphophilum]